MNDNTRKDHLEYSGESFYPSFLFKEIVVMVLIFILVAVILAVAFPVGLGDPADPTDNLYIPKPEWYFMSLYQLLKYFPGRLEVIASSIIPFGAIVLLMLLPFIDKNPSQKPSQRPFAMLIMIFTVLVVVSLTIIGISS